MKSEIVFDCGKFSLEGADFADFIFSRNKRNAVGQEETKIKKNPNKHLTTLHFLHQYVPYV